MKKLLILHPNDNVAVRLEDGHKVALRHIAKGEKVIKYGFPIGISTQDIQKDDWAHTHNIRTTLAEEQAYTYEKEIAAKPVSVDIPDFLGYKRQNGGMGIRNEIWIIPTVGCVNQIVKNLEKMAQSKYNATDNFDGIYSFTHPYGCSQMGEDQENTRKILAGIAVHPNAGGVLIVGLGCENTNIDVLKNYIGDFDPRRVRFMVCQEVPDEYEEGLRLLDELYSEMVSDSRETIPISELKVGLKCGGSDGYSGITANPLVGKFSDMLVSNGGTIILSEVPEMFGAETLLMNRAENEAVFHKIVSMIQRFKQYFVEHNQVVYENPSPGNKDGGITTLEEKSLGCVQKGGTAEIADVLEYGEKSKKHGLQLLYGPGNDMVSATAFAAEGCQLILFTTGRGTPLGTIIPTYKIATNTGIYQRKEQWFDWNAGTLLEEAELESMAQLLMIDVLKVADGRQTANEKSNFREIALWKDGVTL